MLTIYYKDRKTRDLEHRKVDNIKKGVWVHVESPTADELRRLVDEAGLDEGLLTDATDPHEVPRVEKEGGATYVFLRAPYRAGSDVRTAPLVIIVANDFVVTVSGQKLPMWKPFFDTSISFLTTQKTKLFFLIVRQLNRSYQRLLTEMSKAVRRSTVNLENITNKDIVAFVRYEQTLNDFLRALTPTNFLLKGILSGKYFKLFQDDDDLIEDLTLSNGQLIEEASHNLKSIRNVRESYSSIMSNNLNQTIKVLTAMTIVLTVPTMIASFFGMNVTFPFSASTPGAFWIIMTFAVVVSIIITRAILYKK